MKFGLSEHTPTSRTGAAWEIVIMFLPSEVIKAKDVPLQLDRLYLALAKLTSVLVAEVERIGVPEPVFDAIIDGKRVLEVINVMMQDARK